MLAGVVGAAPGGVVAVVGGDDDEVAVAQGGLDLRDAPVEGLERGRIAGNVAAVAEFAVEIDEIGEDEAAVGQILQRLDGGRQAGIVAVGLDLPARAAMGEDVADLADRDDGAAGLRQRVEDGVGRAAAWRNPCGCRCA